MMEGKGKHYDGFDYSAAISRLENLAEKAEDPATGVDDIAVCIAEADSLIKECRKYLRTARETLEKMDVQN